jgi:hypothetical protein
MTVLVDSSVWIDYFRSGKNSGNLDSLIDENIVATNDLILTEMVPYLKLRKQRKIVGLLNTIERAKLDIRWDQLIDWQYQCLMQGLNGIGIPDYRLPAHADVGKAHLFHKRPREEISAVKDNRFFQHLFEPVEIRVAELVPVGDHRKGVGAVDGIVLVVHHGDRGIVLKDPSAVVAGDRIIDPDGHARIGEGFG